MKRIRKCPVSAFFTFIIFSTLLNISSLRAQITFEAFHDSMWLDQEFKTVQISPTETKWYFNDTVTNTFSLFNMDYTPFLTNIHVPQPFNSVPQHFEVVYITRSLFDCDTSNIEFVYEAPGFAIAQLWIMRTDGTILFHRDSTNLPYCGGCRGGSEEIKPIVSTSGGTKLFMQRGGTGRSNVTVYALCGSLPAETFDLPSDQSQSFVQIFPNPASNSLTFDVHPPDNMNEYELVILDNTARELRREKIFGNNTFIINMNDYAPGTYLYSFCTKNKSYQVGKFILNH